MDPDYGKVVQKFMNVFVLVCFKDGTKWKKEFKLEKIENRIQSRDKPRCWVDGDQLPVKWV